ncbi:MAG: DUF389 domain-containing protein [Bacteroidia bacterium]|nr:DUF389 domain-containing protein [Bacteroidia bacterium]NND50843.1 DUF389 domain-containing protein [Flavobacteriaceae bacterium]
MEENKFNFSEEEKQKEQAVEESKKAVKEDAKGLLQSTKRFFVELLDFRYDTDRDATIEAIKGDISFKGATAWILICSIFVASVGLNANSTAVVIGAMLISPLMGPILGVGMSIAVNDIYTLRRSLINLATMIVLSLLTAFLFFYLFPLSEDTSELLGRTRPDIRDVLIAFFGGLALIIARTKKGTIASVIFGVAIATALMPPLCTAGYGLAIANWEYFGGAMYLFGINTIFIALATFVVLKLLRFPMLKYANSAKRKRIARFATLLAIIVMVPAVWTFINVLKESNFNNAARKFINNELKELPNSNYVKKNAEYRYIEHKDTLSYIRLNIFGLDVVPDTTKAKVESKLSNDVRYSSIKDADIIWNDYKIKKIDNLKYMEELRSRDSLDLLSQREQIKVLEDQVKRLSRFEEDQSFPEVSKEVQLLFKRIERFAYSNEVSSNFTKTDTLDIFTVKWIDSLSTPQSIMEDRTNLEKWLKERLDLDTLVVRNKE